MHVLSNTSLKFLVISVYPLLLNLGILKVLIKLSYYFLPILLYKTILSIGWDKNSVAETGLYNS